MLVALDFLYQIRISSNMLLHHEGMGKRDSAKPKKRTQQKLPRQAQPVVNGLEGGRRHKKTPENSPTEEHHTPNDFTAENSRKKKKHSVSEVASHKDQLAALKDRDPEFYKYLLETDKELLDFQAGSSASDEDDELEVRQMHVSHG